MKFPHPLALLCGCVFLAAVGSHVLPAGEYDRRDDPATGRRVVVAGTYHAVKFAKYAHRDLAEVPYRFNRRFDLRSILRRLVRVAAITEPRNRGFIREAEVYC